MLSDGRSIQLPTEPFIKEIIRPIEEKDTETLNDIAKREREAFIKSRDLIAQHKLNMKLLKAEYLFDLSRLILYYKAENKVDFRELLKSLASTFKTRIELRQIGVRDETKLLGGIGCCGKQVCCAQFMTSFQPVSTKMAKEQNLSMNPGKLSGICQRLLCCLAHEHEYYASFHGKYPKIGAEVLVGNEKGRISDLNFLTQKAVLGFSERRKLVVSLEKICGKKDPQTGRNLWWVQEPGTSEPDLSLFFQAQSGNLAEKTPPPPPSPSEESAEEFNDEFSEEVLPDPEAVEATQNEVSKDSVEPPPQEKGSSNKT